MGKITQTNCSSGKRFHQIQDIEVKEYKLLKYRIENFFKISGGDICDEHKRYYLDNYYKRKTICCNPYGIHKKYIKTDLRTIELHFCDEAIIHLMLKLEPGNKICIKCQRRINSEVAREKLKLKVNGKKTKKVRVLKNVFIGELLPTNC